jgi:hypothetical protein
MQSFPRNPASAFNTFVNPIGLGNIGWKFYIVYVVSVTVHRQFRNTTFDLALADAPFSFLPRSGSPSKRP